MHRTKCPAAVLRLCFVVVVFFSCRECHEHALVIREKIHGHNHPSVASALGNLAIMWEKVGYKSKAISLNQEALDILEKVFGSNHPEVR